jgi:hypothetical protein
MVIVKVIDTQDASNMTTLPRRSSTFQTVLTLSSSSQASSTCAPMEISQLALLKKLA